MLKEDKKLNRDPARELLKNGIREVLLYIFIAISGFYTVLIAIEMWSWWPFAGWLAAVIAFGVLLECFDR